MTAAAAVAKVAGGDHLVAYLSPADIDLDVAKGHGRPGVARIHAAHGVDADPQDAAQQVRQR